VLFKGEIMAQSNYSKILIYGSATPNAEPLATNLESSVNGVELALNYEDGKLFYKDAQGAVQLLASKNGISPVTGVTATAPLTATDTAGVINIALTGNIPNTQVTGLGTMSVQNANAVAITGGTATTMTSVSAGTLTGTTSVTTPIVNNATTLALQGGGVTGLTVSNQGAFVTKDPTQPLEISTKQYVDQKVVGAITYKGLWDADTNTPTLESGVGFAGELYVVSVSGTTTLDGVSNWVKNNWALFDGTEWQQLDAQPSVYSVNGQSGDVVLNALNLPLAGTMITQNADAVAITGGTIDGTVIGGTTPDLITGTVITATQYVGISGGAFA